MGGFLHFYLNINRIFCKQTVESDQTPHSDLGLHLLSMSHKKDDMLIWVKKVSSAVDHYFLSE